MRKVPPSEVLREEINHSLAGGVEEGTELLSHLAHLGLGSTSFNKPSSKNKRTSSAAVVMSGEGHGRVPTIEQLATVTATSRAA